MSARHRKAAPMEGSLERSGADRLIAPETPVDPVDPVDPVEPAEITPQVSRIEQPPGPRWTRSTLLVTAVVAVVLGVALVAWLVARDGAGSDAPGGSQVAQTAKPVLLRTLLVQVSRADGVAITSALLGVQPDGSRGTALLIPSQLVVDVAGSGSEPFGEASSFPASMVSADALTDLTGVRIDGSWVLSPFGLAALVDRVGGVQVDVDVDVTGKNSAGAAVVLARPGRQRLAGPAAAAFATFAAKAETEQSRLARFSSVLDGVLTALPAGQSRVIATLDAVGTGSSATQSGAVLAALLADAHVAASAHDLQFTVLPVTDIDNGGSQTTYGIDAVKADPLIAARFAGAVLAPGRTAVRVLVKNGVGTPGLVETARGRLVAAGNRFVNGGNADTFTDNLSVVLVADGTERSATRGAAVAKVLGLPAGSVQQDTRGQTVADVIVVLGRDFTP